MKKFLAGDINSLNSLVAQNIKCGYMFAELPHRGRYDIGFDWSKLQFVRMISV